MEPIQGSWCVGAQYRSFENAYSERDARSHCDRCQEQPNRHGGNLRTEMTFPGGWKVKCATCGEAWLVLDEKSGSSPQSASS